MSQVRGKNTSIEILMGKALWAKGLRYRKQYKKLYGTPDFVLVKHKVAIFCDSAFWHGYKNMKTKIHKFKSNKTFWKNKITENIERDKKINKELKKQGWIVLRFWDFEIKKRLDFCISKITNSII
jgi:DNA mismatch endonuclease, patch repair protein